MNLTFYHIGKYLIMSLVFNMIIDFISDFFVKARVNIRLYGAVFCYGFEIF